MNSVPLSAGSSHEPEQNFFKTGGDKNDRERPGKQRSRVEINFCFIEVCTDGKVGDADDLGGDAGLKCHAERRFAGADQIGRQRRTVQVKDFFMERNAKNLRHFQKFRGGAF